MHLNHKKISLPTLYFIFYLPSGLLKGSLASFLIDKGINLTETGLIVSAMFSIKLLFSPFIAILYDKSNYQKTITRLIALCGIIGAIELFVGHSFWQLFLAVLILIIARNFFQSLMDALAAQIDTESNSGDYGKARFAGSIAVSVGAIMLVTIMFTKINLAESFGIIVMSFSILYFVVLLLNHYAISGPSDKDLSYVTQNPARKTIGSTTKVQFLLCLTAETCVIGSLGALYSTGALCLSQAGFTDINIQALWILAFISESLVFFYSHTIVKFLGNRIITVTLVAALIRWNILGIYPDKLILVIIAFLLQGVIFSLPQSYFINLIHHLIDQSWSSTAQTIYIGMTQGIGIALISACMQFLYLRMGYMAWFFPCLINTSGCIEWFYLWKKVKRSNFINMT